MTISSIDFSSIRDGIKALQEPPPPQETSLLSSFLSYFWTHEPSQKPLEQLTQDLKNKVLQASVYAGQTQDQKIKYAVCEQLLQVNRLLQEESQKGPLKQLMEPHSPVREQIETMSATINDALVRGIIPDQYKSTNEVLDAWGTRFCPLEVLSDTQWEQLMKDSIEDASLTSSQPVEGVKYYMRFAFTLMWTQLLATITPHIPFITTRNWWNKIPITGPHQANLSLGALPLITPLCNDLKSLKEEGVNAVLSVVEPLENHTLGSITSPVTPEQWKEAGIKQLQIPMEDFGTGPIAQVERGVEFIRWNLINKRSVYVHCKAGRGRSALILMAYLIKYENLSADEACARMKLGRPHAGFKETDPKMPTLREYEKRVRHI